MTQEFQIAVAEGAHASQNSCVTAARIIGLEFDIFGEPASFDITAGPGRMTLAGIVPVARAICEKMTGLATEKIRQQGGHIACRPGCCACCHYLVPLSVPEAFRLMQEVLSLPESRQKLVQRVWLLTARRILRRKPPHEVLNQPLDHSAKAASELNAISNWYRSLKQPCPFLREGLCTIYEIRPLACREYFVEGSYRACRGGHGSGQVVELPVRTTEVLGRLAAHLEGAAAEAVMLPLVSVWHQANRPRAEQTWPATEMVERFVEIVKQTAERNLTPAAST
ncbi:MAG TPA: YkgJ family cysteine cluster protein [Sedimentisphaerales bacterium]|nr:YkgJ family cysteine cluster protein [Sedimentisphaerales bacterium]